MKKKLINMLFADMCCSSCKSDFTDDSVFILRREMGLTVIQVTCQNCGKSFGIALLGGCDEKNAENAPQNDVALQIQDGPDAICYDDVLDAHHFFSNLEDDWQKYIPDELKKSL